MDKISYFGLKEDILNLVLETRSNGSSLQGAFGRVFVEYWLSGQYLNSTYPTSRPTKLMALVASLYQMKALECEINNKNEDFLLWLTHHLTRDELMLEYSTNDVDLMLADVQTIVCSDVFNVILSKFGVDLA